MVFFSGKPITKINFNKNFRKYESGFLKGTSLHRISLHRVSTSFYKHVSMKS